MIITEDYFYIDKTSFIKEWWEGGDAVTLITRPRHFGKTLNIKYAGLLFSNKHPDREDLFEGKSTKQPLYCKRHSKRTHS